MPGGGKTKADEMPLLLHLQMALNMKGCCFTPAFRHLKILTFWPLPGMAVVEEGQEGCKGIAEVGRLGPRREGVIGGGGADQNLFPGVNTCHWASRTCASYVFCSHIPSSPFAQSGAKYPLV